MKFNINAPFWQFMNTLARFTALNVVYLLTMLPVVTIGTAQAAMYSTMFAYDEHDDIKLVHEYLRRFKRELKDGLINGILLFILIAVAIWGLAFWAAYDSNIAYGPLILLVAVSVAILFLAEYLFPMQARFANPIGRQWKLTAMFPWRAFGCTMALVVVDLLALSLAYFVPFVRALMIIFGMSWLAYAKSLILLWGFKKYGQYGEIEPQTYVNANSGL